MATALTEALAGGAPMSREVARVVLAHVKSSPAELPVTRPETALTSREIEVVEALSQPRLDVCERRPGTFDLDEYRAPARA